MKTKHGGKRENAGRKSIYPLSFGQTKTVSFKVPEFKILELRAFVLKKLKEWRIK